MKSFITPLPDTKVPSRHQETCASYRRLAKEWGIPDTTAVCYRVKAGFTIREHTPLLGPCYQNFQYLKNWNFPDEPTCDCIVFWIPRLVPGSTMKTREDQIQLLAGIRTQTKLPTHHLTELGKVALVSGLILTHYKATNERIPHNRLWIRTDTCRAGCFRLNLGNFDENGLNCNNWNSDETPNENLGVFERQMNVGLPLRNLTSQLFSNVYGSVAECHFDCNTHSSAIIVSKFFSLICN
ncbi:MAG: hypothetical protein HY981_02350 [Candidatus Magasanikbacteria bacterium]|nr:hypothetical protein [Candidatus Magasanikbacteria bacterium]